MGDPDAIHTIDAGSKEFDLRRLTMHEELGRPFQLEIEAYCDQSDLSAYDFLGKPICVTLKRADTTPRYFHGLVSRFLNVGRFSNYQVYHFVARPWLWFLSQTADCRIFQDKSVPDIIKEVCKGNGFTDFKLKLNATYSPREYCVQYRESDFDFVNRLMEQEGLYYFFEHEKAKHTLVIVDDPASCKSIEGTSDLVYRPPGEAQVGVEHISRWRRAYEFQTGAVVLDDFDFTKPKVNLQGKAIEKRRHQLADLEVFDYPGKFSETNEAKRYAQTRIEEIQVRHSQVEAIGDAQGMAVGGKFKLEEFPRKAENGEYLIIAATIEIESGEIEQFGTAENKFEASVTAIEAKQHYRTPRATPKPVVHGPQTAIVVGKASEEIWTDKYGRVKVQFHWDRLGKKDENSSCWLRMAHTWAGQNWGAIHIPRIGQEVIVDFLEGDPDRPIITGRVYNADQMPPYALPDNQTQSGLVTRSTKKGNAKTANELRFEDKKGEEEVYFHAEKDFNRVVENNDTLKVGLDKKDKGDQTVEIHNNQTLTVGNAASADGSQKTTVWKDREATIKTGDETLTVEKGHRETVVQTGNDVHNIKLGKREVTIGVGNDILTIKTGNQTVKLNVGKSTLDAMMGIELKSGPSSIKVEPSGITIKGPQVQIEGQMLASLKGTTTMVNGSAMLSLKGGIVVIN